MAAGSAACAVRNPCRGASCAPATAGNEKTPAKTTHIAAVPIRIIAPTIDLFTGRNVSDCRAKVNCALAKSHA